MREKVKKQLPLMRLTVDHPHADEMKKISQILDENSIIMDLAYQDFIRKRDIKTSGKKGMTAEQVVRAAIIKQMNEFSYEELAFHLVDSASYRHFCRIGIGEKGFKASTLCGNIKSLSAETWEAINRAIVSYAKEKGIEKGRKVRCDCTVVTSNIHDPSDSSLLWDCVRVITRLLDRAKDKFDQVIFTDHTKRAKRRMMGILNAKNKGERQDRYKDILKVSKKTLGYARQATRALEQSGDWELMAMANEFKHYMGLTEKVIAQTKRRVISDRKVPATEKIVSIFEPHTDIIVKDRRDTFYGHKVCLTGGSSNLIVDCVVLDGNPADSVLTNQMLDRQKEIYGRHPLKVAFDGGFASKDNLESAKQKGIKDVCFSKKRGMEVEDMCRSEWVFKGLRRFRAGIESGISWIKRCFGFGKCTWKGHQSFKSYVWASIVSANLLTLARIKTV
jgi:IS5 family transposase